MKVFFGCDNRTIVDSISTYRKIRDTILGLGHTLTRDWIDSSIEKANKGEPNPGSQYYDETIESLFAANVAIFEVTEHSTTMGHQLTLALQKAKPVLLLSRLPENEIEQEFLTGADISMLVIKTYNDENLENIIKEFLDNKNWGAKVRFNMFIDKDLDSYLNWASFANHRNKTGIVKDAVRNVMEADEEYKKYLKGVS